MGKRAVLWVLFVIQRSFDYLRQPWIIGIAFVVLQCNTDNRIEIALEMFVVIINILLFVVNFVFTFITVISAE